MRNLNYTLINIFGLAIGLASFVLIMIYISDEMEYDKFHEKADRIYRVNRLYNSNDIDEDAATCSFPLGPAMQMDYPDMIESMVRLFDFQVSKLLFELKDGEETIKKFNEEWFYLADSTIFDVFSFQFIDGNPEKALDEPWKMVLSESAAKRWFGDEPAVGKTLRIENFADYEITGVFKDLPLQSHMKIELLGSMSSFRTLQQNGMLPQTWIWNPCWTYLLLAENVDPADLEANFDTFYRAHYPNFQNQEIKLYLQRLTDIHLHSHHDYEMRQNSNVIFVRILSVIAVFVLILACINFMNLATASSAGRVKEIGIKRILGADRFHLSRHFIGEALLMSAAAYFLAAILVELFLPAFNNFTGKHITSFLFFQPGYIIASVILIILVGLFSGSYPAFYLSSLSAERLRRSDEKGSNTTIARKVLVIVQFAVSIGLIIATLTIYSQLNYLRNAELGFDQEQVIIIPSIGNVGRQYDSFTGELEKHKDISYVTGMEDVFGVNHNTRAFFIEGLDQTEPFYFPAFYVRYDFVETFGIEVVEGRAFSRDYPSDVSDAIMINEMMARNMGWTNEEAIGKTVRSDGNEKVIGVFKNFNALSLHNPVSNFILDMMSNPDAANGLTRYIAIRTGNENYKEIISYIEEKWNEYDPSRPFEYFFLDSTIDNLYRNEDKFGQLSLALTILALVIASLGLMGLTSYLVERRKKEICVRKIHGANVGSIQFLLSREFLGLILVSNLISWPIAYLGTRNWLETFSRHIPVQWDIFILSGIFTIILAILIILLHSIKAFLISPAKTLRYE